MSKFDFARLESATAPIRRDGSDGDMSRLDPAGLESPVARTAATARTAT